MGIFQMTIKNSNKQSKKTNKANLASGLQHATKFSLLAVTTSLFAFAPVKDAFADDGKNVSTTGVNVVADNSQSQLNVQNVDGTAVIDIVDPNDNGVSDNRFSKLSTDKGAVFKNNLQKEQSKVLSKELEKNKNLTKAAKVILAQVTGNEKSVIKGSLEVLGNKADLMVINPHGVDLNGTTLLNVKDFTASTAEVNANNYKTQEVKRGEVNVNSLNAEDLDLLRFISKTVKLKGELKTKVPKTNVKVIVSAGTQSYDVETDTSTAQNPETKVYVDANALGAMSKDKVFFEVSESGVGVEFDASLSNGDVFVTSTGEVKVGSDNANSVAELNKTQKQQVTKVNVNQLKIKAPKLQVHTSVKTKTLDLDVKQAEFNKSQVQTDDLLVNVEHLNTLNGAEQVQAKKQLAAINTLTNQEQLDKAVEVVSKLKINVEKTAVLADNVNIGKDVNLSVKSVNEFIVKNDFENFGILNLSQVDLAQVKKSKSLTQSLNNSEVLVSVGNKFANYGLMIADKLKLKAGQQVDLSGATYFLNDAVLVTPLLRQAGHLDSQGNLEVYTNTYKLEGKVEGEVQVESKHKETMSYYGDHSLRRDWYEMQIALGDVNVDNVKVIGATTKVSGNFTLKPINSEVAKQFGNEVLVGFETPKIKEATNRLEAKNAEVFVGGTFEVDGSVVNTVDRLPVKVLDLLKAKSDIVLKFQPRTWINTGLMAVKTQKFDSLYDLFNGLFGKNNNFSWYNGAYKIRPEHLLNTLKLGVKDAYTNKVLAEVFGSGWRKASYEDLKAKWIEYAYMESADKVVDLYSPGAQLFANQYLQKNGDLFVGVADKVTKQEQTHQVNNFSVTAQVGKLASQKIQRKSVDIEELINSVGGQVDQETSQYLQSEFNSHHLTTSDKVTTKVDGLSQLFATIVKEDAKEENKDTISLSETELVSMILDSVKAQTSYNLIAQSGAKELVKQLVQNTYKYRKSVAEAKKELEEKLKLASEVGKKYYYRDYDRKIANLNKRYDHIDLEASNGKLVPKVVFGDHTLNKLSKLTSSAANLFVSKELKFEDNKSDVIVDQGTLTASRVNVIADNVNLTSMNDSAVLVAKNVNVRSTDLTLQGSAVVDNNVKLDVQNDVNLKANVLLDEEGRSVNEGGITAKTVKVVSRKGDVTLSAFKVDAQEEVSLKGANVYLLSSLNHGSTFTSEGLGGAVGTVQTQNEFFTVESSQVNANTVNVEAKNDVKFESAKVQAQDSLVVKAENGDFINQAKAAVSSKYAHEEKLELKGTASASYAGYKAEVVGHLVSNDGKVDRSFNYDKGANVGGSLGLNIGFSYTTTDTNTVSATHQNSELDAKSVKVEAKQKAEVGNLNLNSNVDVKSKELPKAEVKAFEIISTNAKDVVEKDTKSSKFTLSFGSDTSSVALEALGTTLKSALAGTNNQEVDPTVALSVLSNLEEAMIKPLATTGLILKVGGQWTDEQSTTTSDSKNIYKGDLDVTATKDLALKAVDGKDLNNVKLKAEDIKVEAAKVEQTLSSNKTDASLSFDASLHFKKTGVFGTLGASADVNHKWSNTEKTSYDNSVLNTKKFEMESTTAQLVGSNVKGQEATIKVKDLKIESVQETETTRTNSFGLNAGGGIVVTPTGFDSLYG